MSVLQHVGSNIPYKGKLMLNCPKCNAGRDPDGTSECEGAPTRAFASPERENWRGSNLGIETQEFDIK